LRKVAILKRRCQRPGGAEKYLWKVADCFRSFGAHVDLWSATRLEDENTAWVIERVQIVPLGRTVKVVAFDQMVQRRIRRERYDCILSLDKTTFHTHIRAGGGCHRGWLERRARYLPAWRRASEMVKQEIMEYYGVDEERIAVVHNGVEWNELGGAFEEALVGQGELKRQRGLDPDRFYFLFVGSGFERKGLRFAMEALGRLPREASLLVVGRDHRDGRYRGLAQRLGLEGRIIFLGVQRDVVPFYQVADAFVLPTVYDPFSNATLEALAMGLFCVTTKGNGCSEVMADYAGVVIDDPRDTEALAEAMAKAMGGGIDRRRIRESVAHLTLDQHVSKVVDICLEGSH